MKLIRGHDFQNYKEAIIAHDTIEKKLDYQLEIEQYRVDMIDILRELLETKNELIGQLRSEIVELK
ncbi:hypothetical protein LCGC14_1889060 [marine sediment metagenome]|uniref:Uncharacterized protein n=1 Tax=marine sediment metagenome TaxID=412755 RepID=A0A0F9IY74_9ZZZZ